MGFPGKNVDPAMKNRSALFGGKHGMSRRVDTALRESLPAEQRRGVCEGGAEHCDTKAKRWAAKTKAETELDAQR